MFLFVLGFLLILIPAKTAAVPLQEFYPFGLSSGDYELQQISGANSSSQRSLTVGGGFSFYGNSYSRLIVSNIYYCIAVTEMISISLQKKMDVLS